MAFPTIPTGARVLNNVQNNTTATRTFPALSGLTKNAGDLLIAIVIGYQSSAASGYFSGWSDGFTEFGDFGSSSTMCIGAAYKWSTGSETAAPTVTQVATITGFASMFLLSIPAAHASTPPEAGSYASGTGAANPASFDPAGWAAEDTLWVSVAGNGETATTGSWTGLATAPTNFASTVLGTQGSDAVGGTHAAVAFRQQNASAQDVGAWTGDTSNARDAAIVIAVRPAPPEVHTGTVTATGGGVAVATGAKASSSSVTGTGGGVATLVQATARRVAITVTGGGVQASTASSAHVGIVTATGGGIATPSQMTARAGSVTATGGGSATLLSGKVAVATLSVTGGGVAIASGLKQAFAAVVATAGGVALVVAAGAHGGSATATGGGIATVQPSAQRLSASVTATGGGVATLQQTTLRAAVGLATGGGLASLQGASARLASVTATGGGIATIEYHVGGGESHSGSVTATGGGSGTITGLSSRAGSVAATGSGMAEVAGSSARAGAVTATGGGSATVHGFSSEEEAVRTAIVRPVSSGSIAPAQVIGSASSNGGGSIQGHAVRGVIARVVKGGGVG